MDDERVRMRGRLAEYKQQYAGMDISAGSDVIQGRNILDPYEPSVTNLRTHDLLVVAQRLHDTVVEMRDLHKRIKDLEEALA